MIYEIEQPQIMTHSLENAKIQMKNLLLYLEK